MIKMKKFSYMLAPIEDMTSNSFRTICYKYGADITFTELVSVQGLAKKKKYLGMNGKEYIFYHRKQGCSYYDQYLSYTDADAIIFNSAKYLAEVSLGRKPKTEVEIIDEADEFLDNLSNQTRLNLTRLSASLKMLVPDDEETRRSIEQEILRLKNTRVGKLQSIISPFFKEGLNYPPLKRGWVPVAAKHCNGKGGIR